MDLRGLSDDQVAAQFLRGNKEALAELYDRYGKLIYSLTLHLVSQAAIAEEITQEVFLKAWEKRSGFRTDRGSVRAWLVSIAHHRAIDELRRSWRHGTQPFLEDTLALLADPLSIDPGDRLGRTEEYERVRGALERLPVEQRAVLVLAYFHGMTQRQVASYLNQPLGTVKTRTRLALKKLLAYMTREEGSDGQ